MKQIITTLLLVLFFNVPVFAQYPPVQGPPETGEDAFPVQFIVIKDLLNKALEDSIIPEMNRQIATLDLPVNAVVRHTLKQGRPAMAKTEYTDRPNEKVIRISYFITYTIKINNLPNRQVFQTVTITTSCANWFLSQGGKMKFQVVAMAPVMDERSLADIFIDKGIYVATFIKSKLNLGGEATDIARSIKANLPGKITRILEVSNIPTKCNCLSVGNNAIENAADEYQSSYFRYEYKKPALSQVLNAVKVSVKSVRRLNAKDDSGNILYDSLENIYVQLYVNNAFYSFSIDEIRSSQNITLEQNTTTVQKPAQNGSLILIANVIQTDNWVIDSKFIVFDNSTNFGHGTQKLIVKKKYLTKPVRLPDRQLSKPKEAYVDAYELSLDIRTSGMVQSDILN